MTTAAINRFLEHGGLSEATKRAYRADLRAFAVWLDSRDLDLGSVDARVLSDYVGDLGRGHRRLAPASISRRLAAIRSYIRFSLGAASVPDAALSHRRPRRLPDAPRAAEIEELLELADGDSPLALRNRALLELLYSCGLRSAEVVGLNLADVSPEALDRLLIEPLVAAKHVPPSAARMLDAGSGGGSPAIPLALAVPRLQAVLVESKTRKSVFLRETIRALDLTGAAVVTARFEELLARPAAASRPAR